MDLETYPLNMWCRFSLGVEMAVEELIRAPSTPVHVDFEPWERDASYKAFVEDVKERLLDTSSAGGSEKWA